MQRGFIVALKRKSSFVLGVEIEADMLISIIRRNTRELEAAPRFVLIQKQQQAIEVNLDSQVEGQYF